MIKPNLYLSNSFQTKKIKKSSFRDFLKSIGEIKNKIKNKKKTLNILSKEYKFNFKLSDLRKFKNYKTLALIGMGGSILGRSDK